MTRKERAQASADLRSAVLRAMRDLPELSAYGLAVWLGSSPRRVTAALTQLVKLGEVERVAPGVYRELSYEDL